MTPSQLSNFLKFAIRNTEPVVIIGAPGIGKSDIVAQACVSDKTFAGADMILSHPVVSDPTDYKGLPFPNADRTAADFLPYGDLKRAVNATKPTIFFLDDLGQAPPSVQASLMQLVLARRINGHTVSEHVTFVAATNRREDKAHVQGLLEPVKSRFTLINLEVKNDDWLHWADRNGMPAELTSFIRWRPELLFKYAPSKDMKQTPCPRTVAKIGRYQNNGLSQADEFEVFTGVAGEAFAQEYCAFLKLFRNLPDIEDVIARPDKAPDPKTMDTGTLYALTGALGARMDDKSLANILKYVDRMNPEFQIATVQVGTFPEKKRYLQQTKAFIDWAVKHPDLIL